MGHTEMLLAVAGLDPEALQRRTMTLASKDWSSLTAEDRYAFFFAKKQAREPWTIDDSDMKGLIDQFGRHRAIDVLWWASRCHYMTRVADAFQIPLERENVFKNMAQPKSKDDGEKDKSPEVEKPAK
jgi:hypothetical protein